MKYYIVTIEEIYGDHGSTGHYVLAHPPKRSLDKKLREISAGHKCGEYNKDDGLWWFDCYAHHPAGADEITKEEYDVLRKYLPEI